MSWTKECGDLIGNAISFGAKGYLDNRPRLPGLHASSAGKCPKQVAVNYLREKKYGSDAAREMQYHSPEFHRIMKLGHLYHDLLEDWINKYVGVCTSFWALHHHGLNWNIGNYTIHGTPDVVLIAEQSLYIIDVKSAKSIYFWKKNGPSIQHQHQVGSYAGSHEIQTLAERLDCKVRGVILSAEKVALDHHPMYLDTRMVDQALAGWKNVIQIIEHRAALGHSGCDKLKPDWECQYCGLFPDLPDRPYATMKARKDAEKKHGELCWAVCQSFTVDAMATNLIKLEDKPETVFELTEVQHECQPA